MNKICGYNCEHNKGGICQITYCDKIGKMTTTTQEPVVLTRWIDPTIEELKTQLQQKENIIKEAKEFIYKCNDGKQGINYSGCSKLLEILGSDKE